MNAPAAPLAPNSEELHADLAAGIEWLARSQDEDGSWPGNYGGPLFLLPLYVVVCRIIDHPLDEPTRDKMRRYLFATQNRDGGWGLHVEGLSTAYGTVCNYVAARMLGVPSNHTRLVRARKWLLEAGGPVSSASWGKFFLALIDLYPFTALNPLPPELWLLPESAPVHPSRLWCHCRMVYLPMSYLYRKRRVYSGDPIIKDLRAELYPHGYHNVDWEDARRHVYAEDNQSPQTGLSRGTHRLLRAFERAIPRAVSDKALRTVLHQIDREDRNTNYICIGPINKLLNCLVWHYEDPTGPEIRAHRARIGDYLYETDLVGRATSPLVTEHDLEGEEGRTGILMQGYNSSRLWDTTFAAQALISSASLEEAQLPARAALGKAARFIDENQVRQDVCDVASAFRHRSRGGWPFSDQPHGWPISDCTAEGLKSSLGLLTLQRQGRLDARFYPASAPDLQQRMVDSMEQILSMQNQDGGWATYELTRGPAWLEQLNPSDCFRDIMLDYSYVECTSASLQALAAFSKEYPSIEAKRVRQAMVRATQYLLAQQRPHGGFEGSWGVCFTYGTWFGVTGLRAGGLPPGHSAIGKACRFLESKQRADGGWGESLQNCLTRSYDPETESQVVMTAWAALSLMAAGRRQSLSVSRALQFLLDRRSEDGTYPDENIAGVFNKTCAIHYDNYLKVFPLWAVAEYLRGAKDLP